MQAVSDFLTLGSAQVVQLLLKLLKTFFGQKIVWHFFLFLL
jgi:hypothetical protein